MSLQKFAYTVYMYIDEFSALIGLKCSRQVIHVYEAHTCINLKADSSCNQMVLKIVFGTMRVVAGEISNLLTLN